MSLVPVKVHTGILVNTILVLDNLYYSKSI